MKTLLTAIIFVVSLALSAVLEYSGQLSFELNRTQDELSRLQEDILRLEEAVEAEDRRKAFIERLKREEGVVYEIYKDRLGILTLGVGHVIRPTDPEFGLPVGTKVSKATVDRYLAEDIDRVEWEFRKLFPNADNMKPEIVLVLKDMIFNMGRQGFQSFREMNKAISDDNIYKIIEEIQNSDYYHQVTNRANRNIELIMQSINNSIYMSREIRDAGL